MQIKTMVILPDFYNFYSSPLVYLRSLMDKVTGSSSSCNLSWNTTLELVKFQKIDSIGSSASGRLSSNDQNDVQVTASEHGIETSSFS